MKTNTFGATKNTSTKTKKETNQLHASTREGWLSGLVSKQPKKVGENYEIEIVFPAERTTHGGKQNQQTNKHKTCYKCGKQFGPNTLTCHA